MPVYFLKVVITKYYFLNDQFRYSCDFLSRSDAVNLQLSGLHRFYYQLKDYISLMSKIRCKIKKGQLFLYHLLFRINNPPVLYGDHTATATSDSLSVSESIFAMSIHMTRFLFSLFSFPILIMPLTYASLDIASSIWSMSSSDT